MKVETGLEFAHRVGPLLGQYLVNHVMLYVVNQGRASIITISMARETTSRPSSGFTGTCSG
ncbi:hypothetical protein KY285_011264 [Solanum tuberosum]|nr:hypothetical protein KY289_011793 [Solanum tuberosum]KAH0735557.1 hypothetical protein KY285_011264 [Solanum tuberosum]